MRWVGTVERSMLMGGPCMTAYVSGAVVLDLEDSVFVPHSWLLPRCRGIVHHGGSGTVGAALRSGVASRRQA